VETTERINRTAERLARTSADSYKMVIDHVVAQQERNVRFARGIFGDAVREIRHQAESKKGADPGASRAGRDAA
jgi:predicted DNA-binding protein